MEVKLHARSLPAILRDAVLVYQHNFMDILTIAAIAGAALTFVGSVLGAIFSGAFSSVLDYLAWSGPGQAQSLSSGVQSQVLLATVLFCLAFFVISAAMTGALAYAVSERFAGRRISVARAYAAALSPLLSMIAMALLFGTLVGFLSLTVIGLPLAAYLAVQWLFACEAITVERRGLYTALVRSAHLASGNGWRLFGVMATVCLAGLMVTFPLLWVPFIGPLAMGLFVWPFVILASILLYYDVRVRKEGLTVWGLARQMVGSER